MFKDNGDNFVMTINRRAWVSFNPRPLIDPEGDAGETAICLDNGQETKIFILNGDWRKEMLDAFNRDGIGGLLNLYQVNRQVYGNGWSSDVRESRLDEIGRLKCPTIKPFQQIC